MRAPTLRSNSGKGMKKWLASSMALMTSGGMMEPPRTVTTPTPLMTGLTPSEAYSDEVEFAVSEEVAGAADAAATDAAALAWRRRRRDVFMANSILIYLVSL